VCSIQPEIEATAEYDVSVAQDLLPGLLNEPEGLARLVETVLNPILAAQMTEPLGASPYKRTPERQGDRNGVRPRTLYTRVGPGTLQVPQARDDSFSPEIFKRYPRSEQAFFLALMEMVVHGVSTRKVTEITEALCGDSFSKSTVSALCAHLDPRVRAFNERRLTASYPFVWVDALGIAVREDDRVVSKAALIATDIRDDGVREILGLEIGDWVSRSGIRSLSPPGRISSRG
jgi:transposase-like protein